jgi:signal transduction histidine kinase
MMKDFVVWNNTAYVTDGKALYSYSLRQRRANNQLTAYIDEVFANGVKIDTAATNNFTLPNGTNNVQFLLSGISSIGLDYSFKYRLVGENSTWISVPSAQYSVNFPAIAAGKYIFEVIAIATDGAESTPIQITFNIALGWWQNWWLWLAVAFLVFLIIAIIVALRIENINQKNKLIIEKMNLQAHARDGMLAAIRSQMNPHFIFNALNTIQSYIYTNDEDKANSYLGKFSDLIRQILDASQLTHIPLSREISMLQLYLDLELMRFENTLHAVITVDPSVPTDQIEIPPMMVQPYVENAIKHGLLHKPTDRQLSINISMQHDYLQIAIFDNGVGRVKSQQINSQRPKSHQSFATKANQNRLELLNQNRSRKIELSITDHVNHLGVGTGTTVLLKLPL